VWWYFEKIKKWEPLSEIEKNNLSSCIANQNTIDAIKTLLQKLSTTHIVGSTNFSQQKKFTDFLEMIFASDGFEKVRDAIFNKAWIIVTNTNKQIDVTLSLSPEAQEKQRQLDLWFQENSWYAWIEKIKQNVKVTEDALHIHLTSGWYIKLAWKWHKFWHVSTLGPGRLMKHKYTIEQIIEMMTALGEETPDDIKDGAKIGWPYISMFLSEIAGLELNKAYWTKSSTGHDGAFEISIVEDWVYLYDAHGTGDKDSSFISWSNSLDTKAHLAL
jgi:hypothetical protein